MHPSHHRLRYLDGLRGIAIALVVIWHFFGPSKYLPYPDKNWATPLVNRGWMGVQIFFLISGYVIFMTIERSSGFFDFMTRRIVRLWPAMLVASVFLFTIDKYAGLVGPDSGARFIDLVPGLTFITPSVLHAVFGSDARSLDGAFWTLYVEFSFYLFFAVIYFKVGWRCAIIGLVVAMLTVRSARLGLSALHAPYLLQRAVEPFEWLGFQHFGWFASGALFYKARAAGDRRLTLFAILVGIVSSALFYLPLGVTLENHLLLAVIVFSFAAVEAFSPVQRVLAAPGLVLLGFISYPLYLIHNNLGISLIAKFASLRPAVPAEIAVIPVALLLGILAYFIATYAEPWFAGTLKHLLHRSKNGEILRNRLEPPGRS